MAFKKPNFGGSAEYAGVWLSAFVVAACVMAALYQGAVFFADDEHIKVKDGEVVGEQTESIRGNAPDFSKLKYKDAISLETDDALPTERLTRVPNALMAGWSYAKGKKTSRLWVGKDTLFRKCADGKRQSPIDIRRSRSSKKLPAILPKFSKSTSGKLFHDGRILRWSPNDDDSVVSYNRKQFTLQFIDIHMPSEHLVIGEKSTGELQFHFVDITGRRLAIAVLLREKLRGRNEISKLLMDLPQAGDIPAKPLSLNLKKLLPANLGYWSYIGSVTHPPCAEPVDWLVLRKRLPIAAKWVDSFVKTVGFNARDAQPLKNRKVFRR